MTEEIITASEIEKYKTPKLCDRCNWNVLIDGGILYIGEDENNYRICVECSSELVEKKKKQSKTLFDIQTKNKSKNSTRPTMR